MSWGLIAQSDSVFVVNTFASVRAAKAWFAVMQTIHSGLKAELLEVPWGQSVWSLFDPPF